MKILILYSKDTDNTEYILAEKYNDFFMGCGHTTLIENILNYTHVSEIIPKLTEFAPDFGITINLAGFNLLTTGEDSLLTRLLCPFAHDLLIPPYYLNQYLSSRFIFNNIVYVHNESDAAYLRQFYPDIPKVICAPFPAAGGISPDYHTSSKEKVTKEIDSLPDVFSSVCRSLIKKLPQNPDIAFYLLVLNEIKQLGIDSISPDEAIELTSLCYLAVEYNNSISGVSVVGTTSPAALAEQFISDANFPTSM